MPKITRVERDLPVPERKKKVAAYARVSVESECMQHSLSAQVSYYSGLMAVRRVLRRLRHQRNGDSQARGVPADAQSRRQRGD